MKKLAVIMMVAFAMACMVCGKAAYASTVDVSVPVFAPNSNNPLLNMFNVKQVVKVDYYEYRLFFSQGGWKPIYVTTSSDGINWSGTSSRVLGKEQTGKNFNGYAPFELKEDGVYKVWLSATNDSNIAGTKLYYCASNDGINYTGHGVVLDNGPYPEYDSRNIKFPWIVKVDDTYYLYYCAFPGHQSGPPNNAFNQTIACATSFDGVNWTKQGVVVDSGEFQFGSIVAEQVGTPHVAYDNGQFEMILGMRTPDDESYVGYAVSNDGIDWDLIGIIDTLPTGRKGFAKEGESYRVWIHDVHNTGDLNLYESKNNPPTADAGPDQTVEQGSYAGTEVTLDGSGSTDPDSTPGTNDDIVSFDWYEGDTFLGSGEVITYTFPLGPHTVTLVVTDSEGEPDDDEVIITVEDTTPPEVSVTVNKGSLWPPNHKMVDVGFSSDVADICDAEPVVSIEVTSDEPTATAPGAGGSKHAPDAQIADDGALLRAERSGNGDGRVYVITVTASDVSGNSASASASVKVNHNKKKEAVDSGQDYDATEIN
ncbi:MAG: PKD domain-containing protein [Thermodesulfobacteriota bacterium]|nr:PKD domain-containing protein [Thermodesulfobacteriota bacterium]